MSKSVRTELLGILIAYVVVMLSGCSGDGASPFAADSRSTAEPVSCSTDPSACH